MWLQVQFKFNYCIVGAENGAQRALSLLERWAGLLEFSGAWAERWAGVPLSGNGAESGGHKNRQERWAEIVLLVTLRSYAPLTRSCCDDPWKSLKLSLMTPYDKPCTTSYHCFTISLTTSYLNCTVTKISPHTDENCCNTVILLDALERNFDAVHHSSRYKYLWFWRSYYYFQLLVVVAIIWGHFLSARRGRKLRRGCRYIGISMRHLKPDWCRYNRFDAVLEWRTERISIYHNSRSTPMYRALQGFIQDFTSGGCKQ